MRCPAVIPAVALAVGVTAGVFLPPPPPAVVRLLLMAGWGGALAAFLRHRHDVLTLCLLGTFAASGWGLAAAAAGEAREAPLRQVFERTRVATGAPDVLGTVVGVLRQDGSPRPWGATLDIRVEHVAILQVDVAAPGGLRASVVGSLVPDHVDAWRAGRRVRVPVQLRRPARYLDPGVPDDEAALARRGTALVGTVKSAALVEVLAPGSWLEERAAALRRQIRQRLGRAIGRWDARSAAIITAILIGDRSGLDPELERRLQDAGTYHVIAISGGNIAILAALAYWLLRRLRLRVEAATALTMAILIGYAGLVGPQPSVSRATLMAVAYLGARLLDHRTGPLNALAVAAMAILAGTPLAIADAGLALTCGATLALVLGLPRLRACLPERAWLAAPAALGAASLCAELALFPVSAFAFARITFAGLLLNFLAVPLMTVGQIAGMATLALSSVATRAADAAGALAHLAAWGLAESAGWVDLAPWASHRVPPPAALVLVIYYAAVGGAVALTSDWGRARWPPARAVAWRRTAVAAAVAAALWMIVEPVSVVAAFAGWPRSLRVTFLDVGQGDATLVRFPGGRSLLVDAGGGSDTFDLGARIVAPALWTSGVRRLDVLAVTHGDPDHIGGAPAVLRDFRPREIWDGVPVSRHGPTDSLRALAADRGIVWRTVQEGDRARVGDAEVRIWHPPLPDWERQQVRNDDSIVLEIRYGLVSIVLPGDIGGETERRLADRIAPAGVRILKAAHHGSGTSSSAAFVNALRPAVVIFSSGRDNPYGHPVAQVVRRVEELGAAIFRTDRDGAITLDTDGHTVRVTTYDGRAVVVKR
jgi:competence protein ComEC